MKSASGTLQFTANITEGKSGVFQFSFLGNDATVAEFKLYKLHDTTTDLYTYGKPAPEQLDSTSGHWWIADMAAPTVPLTKRISWKWTSRTSPSS